MPSTAKRKGDRAELEVQGLLRDHLGVPARMKPCRDCGDLMAMPPNSKRVYCVLCMRKKRAAATRAARARNSANIDPTAVWHGTVHGYTGHCCRCEPCRSAYRIYSNEWRKRPHVAERRRALARELSHQPKQRIAKKAWQYGLDKELLASYLTERVCFACGATDVELSIDHDHACCSSPRRSCGDCVRGLLCRNCNQALGRVGDSKEHLLALVAYLERWERCASESA